MHFTLLVALVASLAAAGPIPETHVVHEKRGVHTHPLAPKAWIKRDRLPSHMVLPVRIGLAQGNLHQSEAWLLDVSHPKSPNYGKHWTSAEVIEAFQPSDESVDAVRNWLVNDEGIANHRIVHSDNKGWLAFDATVDEVERLLRAEFYEYTHSRTEDSRAGCEEYHVPKAIQPHIDYITPGIKGVRFSNPLRKRNSKRSAKASRGPKFRAADATQINPNDLSTCDQVITPACIRALYQFEAPDPNAVVDPTNSIGIFEEGDFYAQEDLDLFFANFSSDIPAGTHPIPNFVDGAVAPVPLDEAGVESELDFELAYPIIYPQAITLYQTDDLFYSNSPQSTATGIFNTFLDALDGSYCNYSAFGETGDDPVLDPTYPDPHRGGFKGQLECGIYTPTNVISISYGEQEQDLPAYYQKRQCNEYLKLGLQGVSIFVASGDTGVGGIPGDGSANGCLGPNHTIFSPTQPNSCPWLTNVGATKVYPGFTVFDNESAVFDPAGMPFSGNFSSGGGFSNIFGIPEYQKQAVATFFADHNPPYPFYLNGDFNSTVNGLYNRNGRGIPDVAANGDNIIITSEGSFGLVGGTSASSPIFASLVNRIIEERLKVGKGPLGFINPVLYENPQVLNDIVNGTNPGCGTLGFQAVDGWDPVTGLGTPNFPKMLDLFMSLP